MYLVEVTYIDYIDSLFSYPHLRKAEESIGDLIVGHALNPRLTMSIIKRLDLHSHISKISVPSYPELHPNQKAVSLTNPTKCTPAAASTKT